VSAEIKWVKDTKTTNGPAHILSCHGYNILLP
jgi:hypothetical protein